MCEAAFAQGRRFVLISGLGWLLDFGLYVWLTAGFGLCVSAANFLSAIPALTLVFLFSTRRIFAARQGRFSLRQKYLACLAYQCVLAAGVSLLEERLFFAVSAAGWGTWISAREMKLFVKCAVTPVTMICNFIMMKFLTERL